MKLDEHLQCSVFTEVLLNGVKHLPEALSLTSQEAVGEDALERYGDAPQPGRDAALQVIAFSVGLLGKKKPKKIKSDQSAFQRKELCVQVLPSSGVPGVCSCPRVSLVVAAWVASYHCDVMLCDAM